ncbi:MAG: hypothetical protein ACXVHT_11525 [Methanobacterium sp.]
MKNVEETEIKAGVLDTLIAEVKAAKLDETLSKEKLTFVTLEFPDKSVDKIVDDMVGDVDEGMVNNYQDKR